MTQEYKKDYERVKVMLDALPVACFIGNGEADQIFDCNNEAVRLFQVKDKAEFLERFEKDLSPKFQPDGRSSAEATIEYGIQTLKEGRCVFEWVHNLADGSPLPVIVTLERVVYDEKTLLVACIRDMRDHKQMESKIVEQNKLLSTVVTNNSGIIWSVNRDRKITMFDGIYLKKLGFDPSRFMGKKLGDTPKNPIHSEVVEYIEKTFKDGAQKWISKTEHGVYQVHTTPIYNSEGVITDVVGSINDITELITAKEQAEHSNRAKNVFLARMSHTIRTPMNIIAGMAELALRKDVSNNIREEIIAIKRASSDLLSTINDILDLSKVESGHMEIVPRDYCFSSLINDVISIIKIRLIGSKVRFDVDIGKNIPNALFGDETRIRQALLNILGNAIKYTNEGFISFSVRGEIGEEDTICLTIEVVDSGKGMKSEDVEKLSAIGLGFSITKNIIEAMDGKVSVESEYGKGSKFIITLPQKIRLHEQTATIKNTAAFAVFTVKFIAPKAKVLIVDDVETNLKVAEGLLLPYKMQIETALSGQDGIKKITDGSIYDLIFMDQMMPEMDGVETTERIRDLGYKLPIIALTANAIVGTKEMLLENKFDGFLSKPIDVIKLNAVLENWIPKEKQEEAKNAFGDEDKLNELKLQTLAVFHKDGIQKIKEIEKCLETDNYQLYTIYVHALKSAAASIGAKEISDTAKALELAGNSGDVEYIKLHTAHFLMDLKYLLNNIEQRLGERTDKKTLDTEILVQLSAALKAMSPNSIDVINKAVNELQGIAQVDSILQNVLIGNYDEALTEIDDLLEKANG